MRQSQFGKGICVVAFALAMWLPSMAHAAVLCNFIGGYGTNCFDGQYIYWYENTVEDCENSAFVLANGSGFSWVRAMVDGQSVFHYGTCEYIVAE